VISIDQARHALTSWYILHQTTRCNDPCRHKVILLQLPLYSIKMMHNRSIVGYISREWKSSPFEFINKKEEPELILNEYISYNQTLSLRPFCFNNLQGKGNHFYSRLSSLKMEKAITSMKSSLSTNSCLAITRGRPKTVVIE
jgi:hypothetical protein